MEKRMEMIEEELLINRLKDYGKSGIYPFHMPGHKRVAEGNFPDPFTVDITEIEGFDNLHHPEEILKRSMDWAAGLYGADRTYYLVNGSTCGILAAVCGSVSRGGRILMSRNCHKSAYHGVYLNQLTASYVYPQEIEGLGIQGGITADDVDRMLNRYMDIQAVLIVSPTYDGVVSDIQRIAQRVHEAGLALIVDEAHGAHFHYGEIFPVSALDLGADVVIQSVHKTLPSLTQTALLHIKCNRPDGGCYADAEKIDRFLHIYQSSSPSYVLMSSIEHSIFQMDKMKRAGFKPYLDHLFKLRRGLDKMKRLRLVDTKLRGNFGVFDVDMTKIVISTREAGLTGTDLGRILRKEYGLEMEMCGADYVTAITSVMDSPEGLRRLEMALTEIDERQAEGVPGGNRWINLERRGCVYSQANDIAMTISEAMDSRMTSIELENSAGCISGEFVYIYPPGIPVLAPGEWISRRILDVIEEYKKKELPVQGLSDRMLHKIRIIDEKRG